MSTILPATSSADSRTFQGPARAAPRRRFHAPPRDQIEHGVLDRPPLVHWREFSDLLDARDWPPVALLDAARARRPQGPARDVRFVAQTPAVLADGLHYEQRIAARGEIATRERNWHDLLNALVWLRYPEIKCALNARQVAEIAVAGPKRRTRAQCALTHFDEAGVIVRVRDPALLALWDAHDWESLFSRQAAAWRDGRIEVDVFGHALLEHALRPGQLLAGKALVIAAGASTESATIGAAVAPLALLADAIRAGTVLNDPQELRPLPLAGIPGWHEHAGDPAFLRTAPCFRPLRPGRTYPAPLRSNAAIEPFVAAA